MRTRKYILDATERMLQTKGLARLTNKDIAQEAGCTEATIYNHFATKEALILTAIKENLPDFLVVVQPECIGQGSVEVNLQNVALAAIRYYRKLIPLSTSLLADNELIVHFRQWLQESQKRGPLNIYTRVATYIDGEKQLGRLRSDVDAFSFAALLLGSCFQFTFIQALQGENTFPVSEQQYVAGIVHMLLIGGVEQGELAKDE